jgi:hypothetical protein
MGVWDDISDDEEDWPAGPSAVTSEPTEAAADTGMLDAIDDLFALRWDRFMGRKKKKPKVDNAEMSTPVEFSQQHALSGPEREAYHPQTRKVQSRGAKRPTKNVRLSQVAGSEGKDSKGSSSRLFRFGSWRPLSQRASKHSQRASQRQASKTEI